MIALLLLVAIALATTGLARDVPSNLKSLYDNVKSSGKCSNELATGFYSSDDGPGTFSYCGDHLESDQIIYLQGVGDQLVNMDVDCDGVQRGSGDRGRCGYSTDTQSETSFRDTIASYNKGITDLDARIHPYVVLGNTGNKSGYVNFDPQSHGVKPLSLVAVVCGDKLVYGIWGDENGDDDGPQAMVGEASISLATACYGDGITGNDGHDDNDVLYIAFSGSDAVPGADGADWAAKNYADFETSIASLGDEMVQRIGAADGTGSGSGSSTSTLGAPKVILQVIAVALILSISLTVDAQVLGF